MTFVAGAKPKDDTVQYTPTHTRPHTSFSIPLLPMSVCFWGKVSHCSPDCLGISWVAQVGLKPNSLLGSISHYWVYRHSPPSLAWFCLFILFCKLFRFSLKMKYKPVSSAEGNLALQIYNSIQSLFLHFLLLDFYIIFLVVSSSIARRFLLLPTFRVEKVLPCSKSFR